jgi:hypothetical protein
MEPNVASPGRAARRDPRLLVAAKRGIGCHEGDLITKYRLAGEDVGEDPHHSPCSPSVALHQIETVVTDERDVLAVRRPRRLRSERRRQPVDVGSGVSARRTFASILVAIGKDPTYMMQQLGRTDPAFTLRVYSHVMRRSDEERQELKALVEGRVLGGNRQGATDLAPHSASDERLYLTESPALAGPSEHRGARI